jgi:hypothetical protein
MGEKLYRAKLKPGQHLVSSKENPNLKRGTSRDANNRNPDIPEFEEVDSDEFVESSRDPYYDSEQATFPNEESHLTPAEQELARILAEAVVNALVEGTEELLQSKVLPWWANTAWPALKQQTTSFKDKLSSGIKQITVRKKLSHAKASLKPSEIADSNSTSIAAVNQPMGEDSYTRIMSLAVQARKAGMAKINQENLTDDARAVRLSQFDALLSQQVSLELNQILSRPQLRLQESTASRILSATGGGIILNNVYQPVDEKKVQSALLRYANLPNDQQKIY